ncbi:hypothetical protein HGM15179_004772 [Zosterops borbonicus]|uniref:Secreted protein n=1 Tax=Zosterops borbonicus TaxID=364589 RepID=A0A8K1GNI7_9PASS|nr:hypothetical protein HGM15179_004772 [Zosterops borbonicus]
MPLAFLAIWAHTGSVQSLLTSTPRSFSKGNFPATFPQPVGLHGIVVTQVCDPGPGLVGPHTTGHGPLIQLLQILIPLEILPTLQQNNTPNQLHVIYRIIEGALDPLIQITDSDIKWNWPQN